MSPLGIVLSTWMCLTIGFLIADVPGALTGLGMLLAYLFAGAK